MAANKRRFHKTDSCREKIKTSMIVNRLQDHVDGKLDMSASQVTAAKTLLDRTMPVLTSADVTSHIEESRTYEEIRAELMAKHGKPYAQLILGEITPIQYAETVLKRVETVVDIIKDVGSSHDSSSILHSHTPNPNPKLN